MMPKLTEIQRHEAIGMLRISNVPTVARHFNVNRSTIQRLINRVNASGSVSDGQRSGRPRKTTDAEDRRIRTTHLRNRFQSATETARTWIGNSRISRFTVRRRLFEQGIFCRRPVKRTALKPHHIAARLNWARLHRRWTLRAWSEVIFSDESRFHLEHHDSRLRVYRRQMSVSIPAVSVMLLTREVLWYGVQLVLQVSLIL